MVLEWWQMSQTIGTSIMSIYAWVHRGHSRQNTIGKAVLFEVNIVLVLENLVALLDGLFMQYLLMSYSVAT